MSDDHEAVHRSSVINLDPVRDLVSGAHRVSNPTGRRVFQPEMDGPDAPKLKSDQGLPDDCPFRALGRDEDGKTFYYLNALNQLTPLKANDHTHNFMMALVGDKIGYLYETWPQKKYVKAQHEDGSEYEKLIVTGFKSSDVRDVMMQAASIAGTFNPTVKLRGRGAWRDDDGRLVLHLGNKVLIAGDGETTFHRPGDLGGYVYSAAAPMPHPADKAQPSGDEYGPGAELLHALRSWNWRRPDFDADLVFGWIGAAMIGGALRVRPLCWVTGDAATGKSTLQELIKLLFGDGMLQTADTSSAGLYQQVGPSSIPIAVDELEADADNKRQMDVIRLARLAYTGSMMFRGGSDHKGVQFQARSAFLFSSILIPPLGSQDRSRLNILDLDPLPKGTRQIDLDPRKWRGIGRAILRRLVDQWARFDDTLEAYAMALAAVGHNLRTSQALGTLLTCRDMVLFDRVPDSDTLAEWAEKLRPTSFADHQETEADNAQCLNHLCQARPDIWRGGQQTSVAELVDKYMSSEDRDRQAEVQAALSIGGMKMHWDTVLGAYFLAIASTHEGTRVLFRDSRWEGKSGLPGVWGQSLRRVAGAKAGNLRIGKHGTRCTLIPVSAILTDPETEDVT